MKDNYEGYGCVDAGTEYCPCELAKTGDCLICSRLQGREVCDCRWSGVCVYNEWIQNGKRPAGLRQRKTVRVLSRREYEKGLWVLELKVGRGFAQKASRPGSYVFLRRPDGLRYYDTPISVFKADENEGTILTAIQEAGPKSKELISSFQELSVRGVFRGGLRGVGYLEPEYLRGKKVLFVTRGICAAPALLAMRGLKDKTEVCWIADSEKVGKAFLEEYKSRWEPEYMSLSQSKQRRLLQRKMKEGGYDVVVAAASDYYVSIICALAQEVLPKAKRVWSNNARLCCGEGICGACTETNGAGQIVRRCKCQGDSLAD